MFGRAPYVVEPRRPRAKTNNIEATTQMVNQDTVLPVLEALGLPSELWEEVKKRLPPVKLPEKKKERALADLRDKLEETFGKDWRATLRKSDKRQKRLCRSIAVKQHEVDALELEVEQARIKAVVPTPVPFTAACHAGAFASAV